MNSSEILHVNLSKNEEGSFGFSLLGKVVGIPHVIYSVIEDSPAADEVSRKYNCAKKFFHFSKLFFPCTYLIKGINRYMSKYDEVVKPTLVKNYQKRVKNCAIVRSRVE